MPESIRDKLEAARSDVLDLTLRNPLLNFRPSKRRGLEVVDELSKELFKILVSDERKMHFLPTPESEPNPEDAEEPESFSDVPDERGHAGDQHAVPEDGVEPESSSGVPDELLALLAEPGPDPTAAAARHTDNKLQTALRLTDLKLRLRESHRQARLSIEEQGVNVLYLALGMLRWYESDSGDIERRAPLVLIPVQLDRSEVRENFKLSWTQDEIEPNLSLEAKLNQDFNIRLPEMPSDEDLDVDAYLAGVENSVAQQPRWSVARNEIHLNFFSFSKLLIYKDLDAEVWPEESQPADHPLVRQLFSDNGFAPEPSQFDHEGQADQDLGEADLHSVMDADSSQTLAVLDAMNGRNLVIQGPPGTGKSQTIANLIGEALARDMKVLFVAEKMAALEVVKRRLDSVHLGDACLELHSHNTKKRSVIQELKRTHLLGRPRRRRDTEDRVLLEESRNRLNDYSRTVNTPVADSGLTPHQLIGRLAKLEADGLAVQGRGLPIRDSVSWSFEDFIRRRALVREIQDLVRRIGMPRGHWWWTCGRLHFVPTEVHAVRETVGEASAVLHRLGRDADVLGMALRRDAPFRDSTDADLQRAVRTARRWLEAPRLLGADHRHPGWATDSDRIADVANLARRCAAIRSEYDDVLVPEAWDQDVLADREAFRAYGDKWWRFLSGPFRDASRRVKGLCRGPAPDAVQQRIEFVDAILEAKRLRLAIRESGDLVARLFPEQTLDDSIEAHRRFAEAATWLLDLHRDEAGGLIGADIHDLLDQPLDRVGVEAAADACERAMEVLDGALDSLTAILELRTDRFETGEALQELAYGDLDAWLQDAHQGASSVQDAVRFNQLELRLTESGIGEVAEAAASREDAAEQLTGLFEHACYSTWLDLAFRERPVLAGFDGATHAGVIQKFRELDTAQFHRNRALIAERHWEQLPGRQGGGQLGILMHEYQKKKRHLPVRQLMGIAGRAIQDIKPVFMMSPLSIAKYIPPRSVEFDLVVFDEASQVRPVEALGAIIRGRHAVVVGDSKQLPPTNFFDRLGDDRTGDDGEEEGIQTTDLESILGMFCAKGAPERMLRWHYRSRHESLIAVSNHEFYDDRLVVFPSPDASKADTGLTFRHCPDALYEGRGINRAEAKTVALAVMEHARTSPDLTLGVAAFSNVQARRIEDEVDILRRRDPSFEEFFAGHPEEPFFVKNLENVQGDERDVILISIGYGRTGDGRLPLRFGPLNNDGGERRLNVLITRARRRCVVYSNFLGADLDLRRSRARGVEALKTFLEYAETGSLDTPRSTGREADSPFEEAVAAELRVLGLDVEHQVGSAGFFIDLAVRDSSRPGRYLLGIECDGASYHSSRSARDRDRLRQQVLENLGWRIHRIWSTDWFRDPQREIASVEEAVRAARRIGGGAPPVPPRPDSRPLDRVPEPEHEVASPTRPYELVALRPLREPLHTVSRSRLASQIRSVVAVESPVHLDEAMRRICEAEGVGRVGSRIREQMTQAARAGEDQGLYRMDPQGFLWQPDHEAVEVRRRDGDIPVSLRNPQLIANEEIRTALEHVVRVSYINPTTHPDDAVREAIRLFGFRRAGRAIYERFREVLDEWRDDDGGQHTGG